MNRRSLFLVLASLAVPALLSARVVLPTHFTSNMVLQQQSALRIKGQARPHSTVDLQTSWSRTPASATADGEGRFEMEIATPKASLKPQTLTFNDGEETTLENVLIGEVWLGSGQSNMEMPVEGWGKVLNYEEEVANANYPMIRLLQVKKTTSISPREQVEVNMDGWQECSPQYIRNFSALCYFYALRLWEELKVPVGVIDDDWGGTVAEAWVSAESLEQVSGFESLIGKYRELGFDREAIEKYYAQLAADSEENRQHQNKDKMPQARFPLDNPNHPTVLFNSMIHPLVSFPLRGIIWYQGCSNVGRSKQYEPLFQTLIHDWRRQFGNPQMPFYFVQLANYQEPSDLQPDSQWALLREAQAKALCLPNTEMAVNIDLGDARDIHPKTKRELGRRLAAIALHHTYGRTKTVCTAPVYRDFKVKDDKIHVYFSLPEGSEPLVEEDALPGFIVQGSDLKWHVAEARTVNGSEVVVSSPEVRFPIAVRYGWADNPTCTLRTQGNFHVAPFRTDY